MTTSPPTHPHQSDALDIQWDAVLRAPITETEVAFVPSPDVETDQIVVIYNARNAPPVVTIDAEQDQSIFTLRADGTPLAVLSRDAHHAPSADDVLLVARHAAQTT